MDLGLKTSQGIAAILAGLTTNFLVKTGWKLLTGNNLPQEDDTEERLSQVLIIAVISAVILALLKRSFAKYAANWYGKVKTTQTTLDDIAAPYASKS